MLKAVSSAHTN